MSYFEQFLTYLEHLVQNCSEFVTFMFGRFDFGFATLDVLEFFTYGGLTMFLGVAVLTWVFRQ